MAIQVKICGIASADAADAAARAGADFAGLVFRPGSPRHLVPDQAARLAARLRGRTRLVALFSDPKDDDVAAAFAAIEPDFIQLHGDETPDRVADLRARFGRPVIKAFAIADSSDFDCVRAYENVAEMLLFDARAPASSAHEGGHGVSFDWQLLRGRTFKRPWLLAGGLNPQNVASAIRIAEAAGVDVSSGVETAPGIKSAGLIAAFVARARSAEFAAEPST
ncbi:MAG TPA: phosphoribosylanthranilate isomerase [Rhizomicrobium sp.]